MCFMDRYYNEVDLKVCVWNEVAYMKTILDRKGGSEFLHIKYKMIKNTYYWEMLMITESYFK